MESQCRVLVSHQFLEGLPVDLEHQNLFHLVVYSRVPQSVLECLFSFRNLEWYQYQSGAFQTSVRYFSRDFKHLSRCQRQERLDVKLDKAFDRQKDRFDVVFVVSSVRVYDKLERLCRHDNSFGRQDVLVE